MLWGYVGCVCVLTSLRVLLSCVPTCCSTGHIAYRPMLIDMSKVYRQTNLENLDQAFSVAERDLGVTRLLDPEGMCCCCSSILLSLASCGGPPLTSLPHRCGRPSAR